MKRGGKKRARPQAAKKKPRASKKAKRTKRSKLARKTSARPRTSAGPAKRHAEARPAKRGRAVPEKAAKPAVDFERELKRERATRRRLEKRLTALVQELGQIRIYEVRCGMLEEQLRARDEQIAVLQSTTGAPAQSELPLGAP